MKIDFLADHPHWVETLASWHHAEWAHLFEDWTLEVATIELADHAMRRSVPTTLVLHENGRLLGSVSLVIEDAPELQGEGSPWLASLYVEPSARGGGLGSRLARAAAALATEQGVDRLYLFTPDQAEFYERLGWTRRMRTRLHGNDVTLMDLRLPVATAA
jgi:N-acetylglutamate synthase-like GNAT family acetyltransferase